jgi:hypothetical protein
MVGGRSFMGQKERKIMVAQNHFAKKINVPVERETGNLGMK